MNTAQIELKQSIASLNQLFTGIIDYAGLFPPAALPMNRAIHNYAKYLKTKESWMLSRFILPLSKLDEFKRHANEIETDGLWKLAVLLGADAKSDAKQISEFNQQEIRFQIDTVEAKAITTKEIEQIKSELPPEITCYFELPLAETPDGNPKGNLEQSLEQLIRKISEVHACAKIRTGGIAIEAFPKPEQIARFIFLCNRYQVPFKATAGLHHPIRAEQNLTYEPNSSRAKMYGFLNIFLAGIFAAQGLTESELKSLIEEEDIHSIHFENDEVKWRNHIATLSQIQAARAQVITSFGSCSFEEPIEDLKRLNLL